MPVKDGAGQVSTCRAGLPMGYLSLRNKGFTPFTYYMHIFNVKQCKHGLQRPGKRFQIKLGDKEMMKNVLFTAPWTL